MLTSGVAPTSSITSCRYWPVAHNRVAILGTGLIGASIGLAIKAARPQTQIAGYDASGDNSRRAQGVKAIDRRGSLRDVLADADLVIVSTPVGSMKALFEEMAPLPTAPRDAIDEAVKLVESLGASSYFLDPDEHDGLVASVSHLPYLMSIGLIGHLGRENSWRETASVAAGGFAYATHLSDSDPQMFADIMRTNRDNVARRLDMYIAELSTLREAIASDSPGLKDEFARAQALHQDWLAGRAQGQTSEGENPL